MNQPRDLVTRSLLIGAVIVYVTLFGVSSLARYNAYHATTFDLGIMSQVTWNTAHGRWFETSIDRATDTELIGSYLGNHVRPILLFLAPLYRVWPDPRLLLILQSLALGLGAIPLYWIAQQQAASPRIALLIAACYLAYPALGFLNLVDFHPIALSIPLIFTAYWALQRGRLALFWPCVILALFTKEEVIIPIAAWGMVCLLQRERRRVGIWLVVLALAWAALCFGVIIPTFNEGEPYRFWQLWSHLPGFSSQPQADGGTALPAATASAATIALFLIHLALPLGFLPYLGPASLVVALPSLAYLLLGKRPAFHSVGYQYPAVLIPWLFLATVEGLHWLRQRNQRPSSRRLYRLGLAFLLIGSIAIHVPLDPILLYARAGILRRDPYHGHIVTAMEQIPPTAGVATINRFGPYLTNRRILVALEYPPPLRLDHVELADYVLLDLVDCRYVPAEDQRAGYSEIVAQIVATGDYRVRYWADRILLLERGSPTPEQVDAVLTAMSDLVEREVPCAP